MGVLTEARIELRGCAGALTSTAGGGVGTEHGDEVGAEVGVEAAGSGEFVASGQSSPGGLPRWGRRGAPGTRRRSSCSDSGGCGGAAPCGG